MPSIPTMSKEEAERTFNSIILHLDKDLGKLNETTKFCSVGSLQIVKDTTETIDDARSFLAARWNPKAGKDAVKHVDDLFFKLSERQNKLSELIKRFEKCSCHQK